MKNDNAFSVKVGVVNYNFGNDTSTNDYIVFDFLEDQVEIKCMGIKMIYFTYEELNAANFDINDGIKNVNFSNGFLFLIDATTIKLNEFLLPINFILSYVIEIFTFILIFILIFILTLRFNPAIRGIFRFKIVLYACTPFLLCKLFGLLFGITDLSIIGMLLSYFYATSALRAVLKIEVKKV